MLLSDFIKASRSANSAARSTFRHVLATLLLFVALDVSAQQKVTVRGVITSADDGLPLIGASVMDNQGGGVVADLDGNYEIMAAPGTMLIFSSIGFEDTIMPVPEKGGVIDVAMKTESIKIEDAVVVA